MVCTEALSPSAPPLANKMFVILHCTIPPLRPCGPAELRCVELRERCGASVSGVEFGLREQWVMGRGREYTAQKNDRG